MPTYSITAPNGKTYQVDGPPGATDEQVRAEVMRQNPETNTVEPVTVTAPKPATLMSTLGRAAWNLPADLVDTGKSLVRGADGAVHAVLHPVQALDNTATAVQNVAHSAAQILGGGVQHLRDMSPTAEQGDAPRMDTTAYDSFAKGVHDKYLTKQGIYKQIGDHPVGALVSAASVAMPALKAVGAADALGGLASKVAGALGDAAPAAKDAVETVTGAQRRANAATATMRDETAAKLGADKQAADAAAQAAQDRAGRTSEIAAAMRARRGVLAGQSEAALADAAAPELQIGDPRHLSEIGDSLRAPAVAQQTGIETQMRAADTKYRTAMQAVADDRAKAGVGISDTAGAKDIVAHSKAMVDPDPATRAAVGYVPVDSAGGKLHNMAIDALSEQHVPLSPKDAIRARKAGFEVQKAPDGSYFRMVKPDLQTADNFRRFLGKVLDGKVEGYEAINRSEAGKLYGDVSRAIDEYVGGASKPVQENWATGKAQLEKFERVRAGQAVVGTQNGTAAFSVPASNIPGRVLAGGRDTIQQTAAVAGGDPVSAAVRSQVQNALAGLKGADEIEAAIKPGTKLGDVVNSDPDLRQQVQAHLNSTRIAEAAGARADTLAQRAAKQTTRAQGLDKLSTDAQANAEKAVAASRGYAQELASLEMADPAQVGTKYVDILKRAHTDGTISTEQLSRGLKLAAGAQKDFAIKATRDKWLRRAAWAAGLSTVPAAAGVAKRVVGGS